MTLRNGTTLLFEKLSFSHYFQSSNSAEGNKCLNVNLKKEAHIRYFSDVNHTSVLFSRPLSVMERHRPTYKSTNKKETALFQL